MLGIKIELAKEFKEEIKIDLRKRLDQKRKRIFIEL